MRPHRLTLCLLGAAAWSVLVAGCGTTQWTDTKRTATEQLVISDAIDRAVSRIDLRPLSGQKIFLDRAPLKDTVDENYTVSVLRQHMLASGCVLKEKAEQADYIVEVRAGAVGTSRHDVLYGIPSTDLPASPMTLGVPSRIPEIPIAKKTDQQGVAKLALFAYHRETGVPLWQSGNQRVASTAKDTWVLGIGPFEQGSIHDSTRFAGGEIRLNQLNYMARSGKLPAEKIWVAQGIQFNSPETIAWQKNNPQTRLASRPDRPADPPAPVGAATGPATFAPLPASLLPSTPGESSILVPPLGEPFPYPRGTIQSVEPVSSSDGF